MTYEPGSDMHYLQTCNQIDEAFYERLRDCWNSGYGYFKMGRKFLHLSTGGWSDNEEIISVLRDNFYFWTKFYSETRGGHFKFEVR